MISGNGVPAASVRDEGVRTREDSQQLRDIQDLIARLEVVNRLLALPVRAAAMPRQAEASGADVAGTRD